MAGSTEPFSCIICCFGSSKDFVRDWKLRIPFYWIIIGVFFSQMVVDILFHVVLESFKVMSKWNLFCIIVATATKTKLKYCGILFLNESIAASFSFFMAILYCPRAFQLPTCVMWLKLIT